MYRVPDWVPAAGMVLLGWASAPSGVPGLILSLTAGIFLLAFTFVFNDYFDARIGGEDGTIEKVRSSNPGRAVLGVAAPLVALLVILPFLPRLPQLAVLAFLGVSVLYSAPPLRLTRFPPVSLLLNVSGAPLLILLGVHGNPSLHTLFLLPVYSWFLFLSEVLHQFDDREEDRTSGRPNIVDILGDEATRQALLGGLMIASLTGLLLVPIVSTLWTFLVVFAAVNGLRFARLARVPTTEFGDYRDRVWGKMEAAAYLGLMALAMADASLLLTAVHPSDI